MRALLDVNVLLALFDPAHSHHPRARGWWVLNQGAGWASCPLTQNGFLRVSAQLGYPRPVRLAVAASVLRAQIDEPGHEFWAADISITDSEIFDHSRILGPNQIGDVYLLALAIKNGGRLATFDRGIPLGAVRDAGPDALVVI